MPKADLVKNKDIALCPDGGVSMSEQNNNNNMMNGCGCQPVQPCGCQPPKPPEHETGYWCPPPPFPYPPCPPCPPPYPYDCPPVNPCVGSIEAQIAKLSKKSATIRKMIDSLINCNKSILISIGNARYNFGTYLNKEGTETDYGVAVLDMLEAELAAIKAKIVELTAELEVTDESTGGVEDTVTK